MRRTRRLSQLEAPDVAGGGLFSKPFGGSSGRRDPRRLVRQRQTELGEQDAPPVAAFAAAEGEPKAAVVALPAERSARSAFRAGQSSPASAETGQVEARPADGLRRASASICGSREHSRAKASSAVERFAPARRQSGSRTASRTASLSRWASGASLSARMCRRRSFTRLIGLQQLLFLRRIVGERRRGRGQYGQKQKTGQKQSKWTQRKSLPGPFACSPGTEAVYGKLYPSRKICATKGFSGGEQGKLFFPAFAMRRLRFEHCRMTGVTFAEGAMNDVTFADCMMDYASLAQCKLERVEFLRSPLRESELDGVQTGPHSSGKKTTFPAPNGAIRP